MGLIFFFYLYPIANATFEGFIGEHLAPNFKNWYNFPHQSTIYFISPYMLSKYASPPYDTQILTIYRVNLIT